MARYERDYVVVRSPVGAAREDEVADLEARGVPRSQAAFPEQFKRKPGGYYHPYATVSKQCLTEDVATTFAEVSMEHGMGGWDPYPLVYDEVQYGTHTVMHFVPNPATFGRVAKCNLILEPTALVSSKDNQICGVAGED